MSKVYYCVLAFENGMERPLVPVYVTAESLEDARKFLQEKYKNNATIQLLTDNPIPSGVLLKQV